MKLIIEIDLDNAAFRNDNMNLNKSDISEIVDKVTDKLREGFNDFKIRDTNGNTVGFCKFEGGAQHDPTYNETILMLHDYDDTYINIVHVHPDCNLEATIKYAAQEFVATPEGKVYVETVMHGDYSAFDYSDAVNIPCEITEKYGFVIVKPECFSNVPRLHVASDGRLFPEGYVPNNEVEL